MADFTRQQVNVRWLAPAPCLHVLVAVATILAQSVALLVAHLTTEHVR